MGSRMHNPVAPTAADASILDGLRHFHADHWVIQPLKVTEGGLDQRVLVEGRVCFPQPHIGAEGDTELERRVFNGLERFGVWE